VLRVTDSRSPGALVCSASSHPILLYDGVCGLCNRFVQFILRRDRNAVFRFASLQSALAASILARHGANPSELDTVYVVVNYEVPDEYLLSRSAAAIFVLKQLPGLWRAAAFLLQLLPKFLRDAAYSAVARNRYRVFGRSEVCPLPREQDRSRFLDQV
jgi:predicted DCC family thiol-disulfide oxidoreductase YuxK